MRCSMMPSAYNELCLDRGADVDAQAKDGMAALRLAANSGQEAVVRLLLDRGADAEAQNKDGITALGLAAYSGHETVARRLLGGGADVDTQNKRWNDSAECQ